MESLLKLDLQKDTGTSAAENPPKPETKPQEPPVMGKRVHRLLNKAAHKAATEFNRGGSGIFSK